jgi:hypothetical protein
MILPSLWNVACNGVNPPNPSAFITKETLKQNAKARVKKMETRNVPEKKFSTGVITATIWQNQGKGRNGETVSYRTVSLQRRYKDKNGVWQSANSFRVNDLPKAALVLSKAYEYLVLREQEAASEYSEIDEDIIEEVI